MSEKKVSEAIEFRRSVRIFDADHEIDPKIVKRCIEQGVLAPNSSNLQLWEFYHITGQEMKKKIAAACFNQPAARTAKQFVIPVVRKDLWRKRIQSNIGFLKSDFEKKEERNPKKEKGALNYYGKILPKIYSDTLGLRSYWNFLTSRLQGVKKVVFREVLKTDIRVSAHKSTALAAQNFLISMAAYGYDSCTMEGFDSHRIKKILELPKGAEINMVIGCGIRTEKGIYGPRFRVPIDEVYFEK